VLHVGDDVGQVEVFGRGAEGARMNMGETRSAQARFEELGDGEVVLPAGFDVAKDRVGDGVSGDRVGEGFRTGESTGLP
jgi:hypothetical protein